MKDQHLGTRPPSTNSNVRCSQGTLILQLPHARGLMVAADRYLNPMPGVDPSTIGLRTKLSPVGDRSLFGIAGIPEVHGPVDEGDHAVWSIVDSVAAFVGGRDPSRFRLKDWQALERHLLQNFKASVGHLRFPAGFRGPGTNGLFSFVSMWTVDRAGLFEHRAFSLYMDTPRVSDARVKAELARNRDIVDSGLGGMSDTRILGILESTDPAYDEFRQDPDLAWYSSSRRPASEVDERRAVSILAAVMRAYGAFKNHTKPGQPVEADYVALDRKTGVRCVEP